MAAWQVLQTLLPTSPSAPKATAAATKTKSVETSTAINITEGNVILESRPGMSIRKALGLFACVFAFLGTLHSFQRPFREYPGVEYNDLPMAPDWQEKTEW